MHVPTRPNYGFEMRVVQPTTEAITNIAIKTQ